MLFIKKIKNLNFGVTFCRVNSSRFKINILEDIFLNIILIKITVYYLEDTVIISKILLTAYVEQNLGDDLFIELICKRYKNITFYLKCNPKFINAFSKIENLKLIESYNDYKYDLQIFIGGSIFMQSASKTIREKFNCDVALRASKNFPLYILGANFGPFDSLEFYKIYNEWFKSIDRIIFRDKYSYELFKHTNMSWAPDFIFNYSLPNIARKKVISISCIKKNLRSGLSNYNEEDYINKLTEISRFYIKLGYKIQYTCFSIVQQDDIAIEMIKKNLTCYEILNTEVLLYKGDIKGFLQKFLACEYIIGTRFHSIILGLSAGIPVLPIAYNSKLINALTCYNYTGKIINIKKIKDLNLHFVEQNRICKKILLPLETIKEKAKEYFSVIDSINKEDTND